MKSLPKAVVLLSGGLDSATTLAVARDRGFRLFALSFDYGQRHTCELESARAVAASAPVEEHRLVEIDLAQFGGSALTTDLPVPKDGRPGGTDEIPITYVPARNTVFLSLALAWAEVLGANDLFLGVNALDYSGYPDCRPEFVRAFEDLGNLATRRGVEGQRLRVHAPLIDLSKVEIVRWGVDLGVDYSLTFSCYDPRPDSQDSDSRRWLACGRCDACILRREGFGGNGLVDPIEYAV